MVTFHLNFKSPPPPSCSHIRQRVPSLCILGPSPEMYRQRLIFYIPIKAPNGDYSEHQVMELAQVSELNWSQSVPPPQLRMPGAYHSSGRLSEYFLSIAVTI